jgi:hypothetical protein
VGTCGEEIAWLASLDALAGERIDVADTILELDVGAFQNGISLPDRFAAAMERAREEIAAKRWASADSALSEAEKALEAWSGSPTNQELFDLFFLKGAARMGRGPRYGHAESFRQAAALAWNREVRLPLGDEGLVDAYYEAQKALIAEGTALLRIDEGPPGIRCSLDGVDLGAPPVEVRAFGGRHRLQSTQEGTLLQWKRDILLAPGRNAAVRPAFNRAGDTRWVYEQLLSAVYRRRIDAMAAELLAEWCRRHDILWLRIARAEPMASVPRTTRPPQAKNTPALAREPAPETAPVELRPGESEIPIYDAELLDALKAPPFPAALEAEGAGGRRFRLRQVFFDPKRRSLRESAGNGP